jgi:hypothetical protein
MHDLYRTRKTFHRVYLGNAGSCFREPAFSLTLSAAYVTISPASGLGAEQP